MLDQLFETQHLMREGATGPAPTTARTAVLPPAQTTVVATTGATQVVPRGGAAAPGAATDVIERLRSATARARRRGAWAFGAVLVAGAMAAGTGWYYGGGPGSTSSLPSLSGMTQERATAAIVEHGFRVGTATRIWSTVHPGLVSATRPGAGAALRPGAEVQLLLSQGEQPATAPAVKGSTEAAARTAVERARLVLAGTVERASTRTAGTVLRLVDEAGATVAAGDRLAARTPVRLVVSSGPAASADPAGVPTPTASAAY
jgi:eukaryotic-like serine/threonine-protein kinase